MAKDPAFLFYPGDFNTGTQFFSDEQVGKYIRLLMAQHQHGHLSEDQVIFICKSYDNHIFSKLKKDSDGLWYNERLEIEIEKRKNYVLSRGKNKEGKTKSKIISISYENHMENRNENRNIDTIKKELFSDEIWIEQLKMAHKGKDLNQAWSECYLHHSSSPNPPKVLWEWKQKFNTWLTIKRPDQKKEKAYTGLKI